MKVLRAGLVVGLLALVMTGCKNVEMPFREKKPEEVAPQYVEAQTRAQAGDYASAAKSCEGYIASNPAGKYLSDAYLLLGDCRMRLEDYPGAQLAYQQTQMNPRTKAVNARAKAGLGDSMMAQKRFPEAAMSYERALKVDETALNVSLVTFYLGKAYIRSGNWQMGRDRLGKLVDKYPNAPEAPEARDVLFSPSNTFAVQVGAFVSARNAEEMAARLKAAGYIDTRITERNYSDVPFAVRVGHYVTWSAAAAEVAKLEKIAPGARVIP